MTFEPHGYTSKSRINEYLRIKSTKTPKNNLYKTNIQD